MFISRIIKYLIYDLNLIKKEEKMTIQFKEFILLKTEIEIEEDEEEEKEEIVTFLVSNALLLFFLMTSRLCCQI